MTPQQFIAKWQAAQLSERSACQQHFLDLCELLGQPKPAEADPDGAWYTFEKGVRTSTDGQGFADVWMRGKFAWEYKGKRKDLKAAYQQLLRYREDLENPPCLVVCDLDRFEIHTNFTGTAKRIFDFDLDGLGQPANLDVLRRLFTNPESLKPGQTAQAITEQASQHFGQLADGLRTRGIPAQDAAHFLMKLIFCLFAEDIELLPSGLFTRILTAGKKDPAKLRPTLQALFAAMSKGGLFGADEILYFNGGLFADDHVLDLTPKEIGLLLEVAAFDWSSIEPSIFGTLFERTLDPGKRSQIGAHYTSRADIETLLNPVMMQPLRREWDAVRTQCDALYAELVAGARGKPAKKATKKSPRALFDRALLDFDERLAHVTVLDPACGSGNFLYVALHMLLGLEKEVIAYAAKRGLPMLPKVLPTQLAGLEINPYAAELAQVAIWIGYLQWMRDNGFSPPSNPVLEPITSIRNQDAILDLSNPAAPMEPEWPAAEFIVGNPPFLGGKLLRTNLGDEYVDAMLSVWRDRVKPEADLCCYWFEKARAQITHTHTHTHTH
ncbi:MAG TPA: DNA methyltransferase, partial [Chthoniobacteraceae bacterium]|nr:DNA methyltransferase [Chthoniobacteraceae bacterium]